MASETDRKIANSFLDGVGREIKSRFGNSAYTVHEDYDHSRKQFIEHLIDECRLAEKKAPDDKEVLFRSALYKAQLRGQQFSRLTNTKAFEFTQAIECYETAATLTG